ncbi:hypothetical protein V1514DRAFT_283274 [Lipomyces japonicus]|uniref:uncharacterized protein n=1 Tax=Lipomyces japonicus TaxID=56871 RepID=UPI0034CE3525
MYFLILLATWASQVCAHTFTKSYAQSLDDFLSKRDLFTSGNNGVITLSIPSNHVLGKAGLQDIGLFSGDNFNKLTQISDMLALAVDESAYGDALYLYELVAYKGYESYIFLDQEGDFFDDIRRYVKSSNGQLTYDLLSLSSTNEKLREFYFKMKNSVSITQVPKIREKAGIICSSSHAAKLENYNYLKSFLAAIQVPDGTGLPHNVCKSGACASWPAIYDFKCAEAANETQIILNACTDVAFSGERRLENKDSASLIFAASNRAITLGCTWALDGTPINSMSNKSKFEKDEL